ncbi:hypothetical protein R5R35_006939 [Gryllus longicercus]|uniref:Uncharacterized protein n=1 Tax=Gryllus longicercus TaxID=2509291 RepID=A0AAN9VBI9_9ORTH
MATLGDIDKINKNITSAPAKAIQTLHKLIFELIPKDRKNRKRLKEFAGFTFELDSKDFKLKKEFINNSFTEAELGTICSILCINDGTKEVMIDDVCNYLSNLGNLLIKIEQDEEEENDYDENFDTKNKLNDKMDETRDALRKVSADLQKKLKIEKKK